MTRHIQEQIECNLCHRREFDTDNIALLDQSQKCNPLPTLVHGAEVEEWLELSSRVHICPRCTHIILSANRQNLFDDIIETYQAVFC